MSEFGRGYATCLRQFANHRARLREYVGLPINDPEELWANASSDHLYELIRPKRGVPAAEWTRAKALQARALDIGHGFRASSKSSIEECAGLLDEADALLDALQRRGRMVQTLVQAMGTDVALGIKRPDGGAWACAEDITRRPQP